MVDPPVIAQGAFDEGSDGQEGIRVERRQAHELPAVLQPGEHDLFQVDPLRGARWVTNHRWGGGGGAL
jgi:hypothetical protein